MSGLSNHHKETSAMRGLFTMMNRLPSIPLLLLLASISPPSRAQTVDTAIVGTVTDHSGAVVSGARVTVTSASTGIAKSVLTAGTGEYTINYLLPGSYDVAVTANGFTTTRQQGIEVQLSQEARVNFQLQVGGATEQGPLKEGNPCCRPKPPLWATLSERRRHRTFP